MEIVQSSVFECVLMRFINQCQNNLDGQSLDCMNWMTASDYSNKNQFEDVDDLLKVMDCYSIEMDTNKLPVIQNSQNTLTPIHQPSYLCSPTVPPSGIYPLLYNFTISYANSGQLTNVFLKVILIVALKTQLASIQHLFLRLIPLFFGLTPIFIFKLLIRSLQPHIPNSHNYQMLARSTVYGGVRPNYWPWNTFLFWYALVFFIIFFPFLVVDLYLAYRDNTCVDIRPIPNTKIHMSLAQWLQVDAYIMLAWIVFFFILGAIAWGSPELVCTYGWWQGLHVFYIIWRMTWLIVGSVMFWRGLNNNGCAGRVRGYMWAMLIIGYVLLFVELFLAFGYPRPVPYPVSVPVSTGIAPSAVLQPVGATATPMYRPGGIVY